MPWAGSGWPVWYSVNKKGRVVVSSVSKFISPRLPLSVAVVACCYGTGSSAVEIDIAASIATEFTDNAQRTSRDEVDERQDTYGLSVSAEQRQGDFQYAVDYIASQSQFSRDTQERRSNIDGEAFIRYQAADNPFSMTVSHSRRRVLERPQDRNLLENLDERSILTGAPAIQLRPSPVDSIRLSASLSDISYRFGETRDSEQTGYQLQWQHRLSSLDQLSLFLQTVETEFSEVDGFDYEYDVARIGYSAQLRKLSYNIEVGRVKSTSDQRDDFSGPSYSVDLTYETGVHELALRGRRTITDSSLGDGNQNLLENPTGRDGTSDSIDRFELSSIETDWRADIFCDRCRFVMLLGYDKEDYSEDILLNNVEKFAALSLTYSLSSATQLEFAFRRSEQEFDSPAVEDQESDQYEIRLDYDFSADASFEISLRQEERFSPNPLNEYEEFTVRLGFRQNF